MKTLRSEPSVLILDRIYTKIQERPIVIAGYRGIIRPGGGGWGNVVIIAEFGGIRIECREREAADYEQTWDDCPDRLEVYPWERDGKQYDTLKEALEADE